MTNKQDLQVPKWCGDIQEEVAMEEQSSPAPEPSVFLSHLTEKCAVVQVMSAHSLNLKEEPSTGQVESK